MTRFERWSVYLTSIVTTATGVVYYAMKHFLEPPEPWAVVNHPWQPWVLKAHIVAAPLLVFAIGLIALRHVWRHFQSRTPYGRRSGITLALMTGPMILTGYLIQVITHEGLLRAMALAHLGFGVVYALGLGVHQVAIHLMHARRRGALGGGGAVGREPAAARRPGRARRPRSVEAG
ncbi:MAG TPA: hypothetical protein VNK43_02885, partial [Gemmatimonadales bacterium]|nr:hypothetical protein [Gemmatimonadales bacterium]